MTDTLSAYDPSWRERLVGAVQDAMTGMGASRGYAQDFAGKAGDLISMVPGAGNALSANDAYRAYQGGDYLAAALNGAMALPLPMAAPEEDAARGIIAYHGSPYSFDKFDANKIGTGEGAQAYGHGLYFAENEGTAQSYKNMLQKIALEDRGGNKLPFPETGTPEDIALAHLEDAHYGQFNNPFQRAGKTILQAKELAQDERKPLFDAAYNKLADWQEGGIRTVPSGNMYQVRINADPNQFLDWDKPLSEQPDIQQRLEDQGYYTGLNPNYSGADVHSMTGSLILNRAGIRGIRYLDQGSRGAGEGTHNYVVFDPNTIDILKRYGLAGGLAGTGVGAAIMNPPAQAQPQL